MKILGIVLIVAGLLGVFSGGLAFTRQEKVIDAGPLQVSHDKTERLPIPPIAGGILLLAGIVVLVQSGRS
jgi:hypothetical protein